MKKVIVLALVLMLSFTLFGCAAAKNQVESETVATPAQPTIDISDRDGLYDFVNAEIYQIAKKEFDSSFDISFLDITDDGFEEALLVNNNDWSTNIEIVMVNGDKYENIKTDVQVAKYKNEFEMQDGFLKVVQKSGGTGVGIEVMSLLKYDNGRMITVLPDLELSYHEAQPPDWICEHSSQINGPLTDFQYILTCDENGEKYINKRHYTYNENTLSFDVKTIEGDYEKDTQETRITNKQAEQTGKTLLADSGLTKEIIRGNNVDYVKYDLVVIDSYPGGILSSDDYLVYTRPGYTGPDYSARDVAIVGNIYDVNYYSCITGQTYKIADQLSNQILVITDEMSETVQSYVSFADDFGNNLQLNIGECDDWFETILVNGKDVQVWGKPEYKMEEESE